MLKGACIPLRVHTVVVSIQHSDDVTVEKIRKDLMEKVIRVVIPSKYLDDKTIYHLNPSGKFVIGGPQVRFLSSYTEKFTTLVSKFCFALVVLAVVCHMKHQIPLGIIVNT